MSIKNDKVRHEAVAPYFASSYMTLVSIVQSISLYVLLDRNFDKIFFETNRIDWDIAWKSLITLFVIGIIWHRYIAHTQYLAWRLKAADTLIPLGFGILQYNLILSCLEKEKTFIFAFAFMLIFCLGSIAYFNSMRRFSNQLRENLQVTSFSCGVKFSLWIINEFPNEDNGENYPNVFKEHFCNVETYEQIEAFLTRLYEYEGESLSFMFHGCLLGFSCFLFSYFLYDYESAYSSWFNILIFFLDVYYCYTVITHDVPFLECKSDNETTKTENV